MYHEAILTIQSLCLLAALVGMAKVVGWLAGDSDSDETNLGGRG